jgi:hypothetical protein
MRIRCPSIPQIIHATGCFVLGIAAVGCSGPAVEIQPNALVTIANKGIAVPWETPTATPAPTAEPTASPEITPADTPVAASHNPSLGFIGTQTTSEDSAKIVSIIPGNSNEPLACSDSNLLYTSSNPEVVASSNAISWGGVWPSCTATINPVANASGNAAITIAISDGLLTAARTFTLVVVPVDDTPTISDVPNQSTKENVALNNIAVTIGDIDSVLSCSALIGSSSNPTLLPNANISFSGTYPNCNVNLSPAANQNGGAPVTLTVSDGTSRAQDTFTFTVVAEADAPTLASIGAQVTNEDTAKLVALSPAYANGPLACSASNLSYTSSNPLVVASSNAVSWGGVWPACTATLNPVAKAYGNTDITIKISNGSRTGSQAFTLTVLPVNDAPTISDVQNQSTNEDVSLNNIAVTIGDVDSALNCSALSSTSDNPTLLPNSNISVAGTYPNCTVNLTPVANQNGSVIITLAVSDGSLTAQDTFTFTVGAVNDAPTISDVQNLSTSENIALNNIAVTIGDIDSTLTCSALTGTSSNTTLLPNANIAVAGTYPNCNVNLTPAANQNGSTTITLTVSDGSLTAQDTFTFTVTVCQPGDACQPYGAQFFVSSDGRPAGVGNREDPFPSLLKARDALRALKAANSGALPEKGVVVWIMPGVHRLTQTAEFTTGDTGTAETPIHYRGYPNSPARLSGGVSLSPSWFKVVTSASPLWSRLDATAKGTVMEVSLKDYGITDYGALKVRGMSKPQASALELFIDNARMPIARWPDKNEHTRVAFDPTTVAQIELFGSATPAIGGVFVRDGTQDGQPAFKRKELVGGKQYYFHRVSGSVWYISTKASGYPNATDPYWWAYRTDFPANFSPALGATGAVTFLDPALSNQGFASIVDRVSDDSFQFSGDRPKRWSAVTDIWFHGFWKYAWADLHVPATSIDTTTRVIKLSQKPGYGIGAYQPFYAYNILEELTQPGEWYLDRVSGILYLWPTPNFSNADIFVSQMSAPLLKINGASYLQFRDLTLEGSRALLADVSSGNSNLLTNMVLRHSGQEGVKLAGYSNVLRKSSLYDLGGGGVKVNGGDRVTLTSSNNIVENCDIQDFSAMEWSYTPGIWLNGVGNIAQHNKIHDAPHSAIIFTGNEHLIDKNEIFNVLRFSSDAGAIYTGRDWGARGNIVRHNFIHDLSTYFEGYGSHGIYLDDCVSGIQVIGNILYRISGHGLMHGGGRDNKFVNNIVARSGEGLASDTRCISWLPQGTPNNTAGDSWDLLGKIQSLNYQLPPWSTRYPDLAAIPNDWNTIIAPGASWLYPEGSEFVRNAGFSIKTWIFNSGNALSHFSSVKDNIEGQDLLFVDESRLDLNLQANSPARQIPGWQEIPFSEIGP